MSVGTSDAAASIPAKTPTWLVAIIAGLLALGYAYAAWNAIGNLVAVVQEAGRQGLALNGLGWFLWIFAALLPLVVWALALWVGRRRAPHELFLVMFTGLALVAVFWLDVVSYATLNTGSLVG